MAIGHGFQYSFRTNQAQNTRWIRGSMVYTFNTVREFVVRPYGCTSRTRKVLAQPLPL